MGGRRGLEEERLHGNQGVRGSNLAFSSIIRKIEVRTLDRQ